MYEIAFRYPDANWVRYTVVGGLEEAMAEYEQVATEYEEVQLWCLVKSKRR